MTADGSIEAFWNGQAASFDDEPDHGLTDDDVRLAWSERFAGWLPDGPLRVADLGCGTGLGSQFYRPYANLLIGVDVSSKMLQKASENNIYDDLIVFDILQDWAFSQPFDLIYSSDVFVYFGNLDPIIRSASSYLVHGGIIAFSVEKLEDNRTGYQLFPSGRYAHSHQYIRNCLKRHGLAPIEETDSVIRKQSGDGVNGLLIVAEKRLK